MRERDDEGVEGSSDLSEREGSEGVEGSSGLSKRVGDSCARGRQI